MKIYIDFDDVICETAKYFTKIAKELFNIDVPYREVQFFNLQKSFDLSEEQYDALMKAGHIPENLLDYEETSIRIPMLPHIRSLNLSNSVAIVAYEVLRHQGFEAFQMEGQLHHYKW